MDVTYVGALIAGLLSFLSPCVLPLVPPYLCFLGGATFDQLAGEDETPSHVYATVVMSSVAFVLGFTTVFVDSRRHGHGRRASCSSPIFALLSKIAGVIIIIAGLHFLGVIHIPLLHREARYHADARPAGLARRLSHRPRLRLRLDAVHRAGARRDPRHGRRRGLGAPGRRPALRLFARARYSLHRRRDRHQAVHERHAALPPASGDRREGAGRLSRADRHPVPHQLHDPDLGLDARAVPGLATIG